MQDICGSEIEKKRKKEEYVCLGVFPWLRWRGAVRSCVLCSNKGLGKKYSLITTDATTKNIIIPGKSGCRRNETANSREITRAVASHLAAHRSRTSLLRRDATRRDGLPIDAFVAPLAEHSPPNRKMPWRKTRKIALFSSLRQCKYRTISNLLVAFLTKI